MGYATHVKLEVGQIMNIPEPEMIVIPAGEFMMGSPSSEPDRFENEGPQHRVQIANDFSIGKYTVTFQEYDTFAQETQRDKPDDDGWGRGRRPVINVNLEEVMAYVKWLNEQTGKHYRLPTEAEWEYAARAGTTTPFNTGERITTGQANFNHNDEYQGKTVEVGSFLANAFGLHDVHGNVWERVQDYFHINYEGAPGDGSAWGLGDCTMHLIRGGGWRSYPKNLRSANRFSVTAGAAFYDLGFRLAMTL